MKIEEAAWPRRKGDRVGMRVVLRKTLETRLAVVPEGTLATIRSWHGGAHITCDSCSCCGAQVHIDKVPEEDIMPVLVSEENPPDKNASQELLEMLHGYFTSGRFDGAGKICVSADILQRFYTENWKKSDD